MTEPPNIPNLNSLVELGRRDGVDIRPTLLRVMTELYVQAPTHTPEEERHFTELALRLIELVDPATRSVVADRIAAYPAAPAAVRRRLLRDKIVLGPPSDPGPDRADSPPEGERAEDLSELFFAATSEERRLILLNLPYAPLQPAQPIPEEAAREATRRLEAAAISHNGAAFVRELQRTLQISRDHARRLLDDASGEPVVVAAVALGMPAAVLQRILLCLHPAVSRSVQRVYDLAVLHEEIERQSALQLLAIWRSSHRPENEPRQDTGGGSGRSHGHESGTIAPAEDAASARRQYRSAEPAARALPPARPKIEWDLHARSRIGDGG
jgi:hypothetical protein